MLEPLLKGEKTPLRLYFCLVLRLYFLTSLRLYFCPVLRLYFFKPGLL